MSDDFPGSVGGTALEACLLWVQHEVLEVATSHGH